MSRAETRRADLALPRDETERVLPGLRVVHLASVDPDGEEWHGTRCGASVGRREDVRRIRQP